MDCYRVMEDTIVLSSTQFETSAPQILLQLWTDREFADVTLATADGQLIPVHQAILSACSPFLRHLLLSNPHPKPLIYLKGVQVKPLNIISNCSQLLVII